MTFSIAPSVMRIRLRNMPHLRWGQPLRIPLCAIKNSALRRHFLWRRVRDSNPRFLSESPVFKTGSLNRSDNSPCAPNNIISDRKSQAHLHRTVDSQQNLCYNSHRNKPFGRITLWITANCRTAAISAALPLRA